MASGDGMSDIAPAVLRIESSPTASLVVTVLHRTSPEAMDFDDGNWIECRLDIRAGAFVADGIAVTLRAEAFDRFRRELAALNETKKGNAIFEPMEPWLRINLKGDCRHELDAVCVVCDSLGGNELRFTIPVRPADLPRMLGELAIILEKFPVRGR
jgi:hypothetical protein